MKKLSINVLVWKEEKWFVARSLEINVASQGKTKDQALKNLKEAIELYLEDENIENFPSLQSPQLSTLYV